MLYRFIVHTEVKHEAGFLTFCVSVKPVKPLILKRSLFYGASDCIYPVKTNVNIAVNRSEFVTAGSRAKRAKTCNQCRKTCPSAGRHVIKKVCNQCQTREGVSTRLPLVLVSFLICPRKRWYSQIVHNAIS